MNVSILDTYYGKVKYDVIIIVANVIGKLFDGKCISFSAGLVASIKQANKNRIRENEKIKEWI